VARNPHLKIQISADGKQAESQLGSVGKAAGKLGAAMKAGAAVAGAAVVALGVAAVKSASSLEQAVGASGKIFKEYSDDIVAKSKQADMALGLSQSAYLDLANVIGSQLKNAGTPMDQLGASTDKLITKGADLAATFGGTTADAVNALSSALKGEMDPIERYGVSIRKSDVNARLAEQGLDKLTGAALKAAEQQALLGLINEQTADSTGQFAAESETAAGIGQRAAAVWENTKATLGAGLLPILVQVGTFFLENIVPAVQAMSCISSFITGKMVPTVRTLWQWFTTKLMPGIKAGVTPVINGARTAFQLVRKAIDDNRPAINKIVSAAKTLAEFFANRVMPIVGRVQGVFLTLAGGALSILINGIGRLVNGISSAIGWFSSLIRKVQEVANKVKNSGVGKALGGIASIFGSHGNPAAVSAGMLSAAGGPPGVWGLMPSVSVEAPQVAVYIGEREISGAVRTELRKSGRAAARRELLLGT